MTDPPPPPSPPPTEPSRVRPGEPSAPPPGEALGPPGEALGPPGEPGTAPADVPPGGPSAAVSDAPPGEPLAAPPTAPPGERSAASPAAPPTAPSPESEPVEAEAATAPPRGLWTRMRDDPQYAPEHLALEAVRRLGPEARDWARRSRAERPDLNRDALAQVAVKKFLNLARLSGAVSGAAGLPGAVVDVGVLAWTQARMVLHIAAAYDVDPVHPDRATDLLVLQRVHKAAEGARLALAVAAGRERASVLLVRAAARPLSQVMLRLGVKLAQMAGVRAAKRVFAKLVPGAAIILGTWVNSSATASLARRTVEHYRLVATRSALPPAP